MMKLALAVSQASRLAVREEVRANRRTGTWLLAGALALSAGSAMAQQNPLDRMASSGEGSVREAVQRAVSNNPEVQEAWNAFQASEYDVDEAQGGYLPSIDVTGGVGRESREGDGRGSYDTDFAEISLTQMIYDGFATRSEVERLDHAKLVSYYEVRDVSQTVALDVLTAYQDVMRYRELVRLAQDNYRQHLEVYDQIEQRVQSGAGRRVDLEQISGRLSLAESNLMTEASNLHDVSARYQRLVGELPPESLSPVPDMADRLPPSVMEAVELAYEGNPGFHAAIENIESARAEREGTKSAFQPRVEFRARAGTNNESGVTGRYDQNAAEIVASMNLYNGGSDLASYRRGGEQIEQAMNLRDKECVDLRQTTQIAYNDTQRLREQLAYLNEHRQSIDRVRGAYEQQFNIGERTLLDLLDSENEYFDASRAYVNAQYDAAIADAEVLASMGQLLTTLDVAREDMPTLGELGSDGVDLDPDSVCPAQGPAGFTLDDLTAGMDMPGDSASTMEATTAPTQEPDVTLSADALFETGSAWLNPDVRSELDSLAADIRQRDDLQRVFIAGHADSTGSADINDPLSQARADRVAEYLAGQGVSEDLLQTRGYGANNPVADNGTAEGRSRNRRVEVTLEGINS
ncbi:TolC family outer membrane protein [Aidingimonas lacisalsi]|uniref:TolC family outer membrane protein n=1 Tax=Aidingimonas lacisalsi TaxID=2604086 RepID=UPI001F01E029|nr:TolC family outer membrane protein [Aidingimonas lacisalsi]